MKTFTSQPTPTPSPTPPPTPTLSGVKPLVCKGLQEGHGNGISARSKGSAETLANSTLPPADVSASAGLRHIRVRRERLEGRCVLLTPLLWRDNLTRRRDSSPRMEAKSHD